MLTWSIMMVNADYSGFSSTLHSEPLDHLNKSTAGSPEQDYRWITKTRVPLDHLNKITAGAPEQEYRWIT